MAWRFRRSIKIAPGVRWNIGKRSTSFSFGPRGFKLTAGTSGVRQTVGIPGTGLSYTEKLGSGQRASSADTSPQEDSVAQSDPAIDPTRFGVRPSRIKRNAWLLTLAFFVASILAGQMVNTSPQGGEQSVAGLAAILFVVALVSLLVALVSPKKDARAKKELARRVALFRSELSEASKDLNQAKCQRLLKRRKELRLIEQEVAGELETVQAYAELFEFEEHTQHNGNRFPILSGHERVVGEDSCYFVAPAFLDKRGPDESGQLFLTNERMIFLGSTLTDFSWKKVATAQRDGRAIIVQRNDRQNPYRFDLNSLSEALRADFVTQNALAQGSKAVL